jgi:PAS domain S-box-containing protein/putative nucleotidyltransferase with HDIG domain
LCDNILKYYVIPNFIQNTFEENIALNDKIAHIVSNLGSLILNQIHDLIAIHKIDDLSYQYANPATFRLLGYTQDELYGKSPIELIHPDDIDRALDNFKRILLSGHSQDQLRYRKKDGTYLWLEVNGTRLDTSHDNNTMIIISRKIEHRRIEEELYLSEQRYRVIVENQTELVGRCTPDTSITFANQALLNFFSNGNKTIVGKPFLDLVPAEYHDGIRQFFSSFTLENSIQKYEIPIMDDGGEVRWLEWTTRAISNESGEIVEYQGVARDITDHKWEKDNLIKSHYEVEAIVEEKIAEIKQMNEYLKIIINRQIDTQKALKESENYYRTIFENAGTAIVIVNEDLKITAANLITEQLSGYKIDELIGLNPFETFVLTEYLPIVRENYNLRWEDSDQSTRDYEIQCQDRFGNIRDVVLNGVKVPDSQNMVVSIIDVSERNRAWKLIKSSEERFRKFYQEAPIAIGIHREWQVLDINQEYLKIFGYKDRSQIIGTPFINQLAPDCREEMAEKVYQCNKNNNSGILETTGQRSDGSTFPMQLQLNTIEFDDGPASITFCIDITAQKKAENTLQQQIAAQSLLLEISKQFSSNLPINIDAIIDMTLENIGKFDRSDRSYVFLFFEDGLIMSNTHEWCAEGISSEFFGLQNLPTSEFPWWMAKLRNREIIYVPRVSNLPSEAQTEREILRAQNIKSVLIVPMVANDKLMGYLGFDSVRVEREWSRESIMILESVAQSISKALQRKKDAEYLMASENYYRTLFENNGAATIIVEEDFTITRVNEECLRLFKYSREEMVGAKWTDFVSVDIFKLMQQYHYLRRTAPHAVPSQYETQITDREGKPREGLIRVSVIPGTSSSIATFIDLTDVKRKERALKTIGAITAAMNNADSEQDLLDMVCQNIVSISKYQLVWVGYVTDTPEQKVKVVASAGHNNGYTDKLDIALKDPKRNQGPTGTAIRTGKNASCDYMAIDPDLGPWVQAAIERGYKASIALPLFDKNRVFGVLKIYSNEVEAFSSEEEQYLRNMANDLAYAIISMRIRENIKQANQDLENSLVKMSRLLLQAVTSLGAALDVRDPYTAGHQKGVARLAVAIATEMGCTQDQIESIAMASNLHDIGKMSIPSEILSKPSKLTALEFEMIKTHCEAGYEIIRNIEFPWPVAQIILQHHERMNGSGYPHGLNRDNLMLEARIIAVADVVEAMASHRPYRAALGIEAALDEINKNRDTLYDSVVVDACLRLFQKKQGDVPFASLISTR